MTQTTCNLPWICNALSSMDPADNNCIESTSGIFPAWLPNCLALNSNTTSGLSMLWSVQSTLWLTFYSNFDSIGSNGSLANGRTLIQWLNGATVVAELVLFGGVGSTNIQYAFDSLQAGVMTRVGSVTLAVTPGSNPNRFDVQTVGNSASGSMAVYVAGTQQINGTGLNHSAWTGVTQIKVFGAVVFGVSYFASLIADTTSHVGDDIRRFPIDTISGVNTGYTGAVTNINELITNDTTFVYATANAQISTYYASGFSLGSLNVVAVTVAARTKPTGSLAHIELALRTSATNYVSSSIALPSAGYQGTSNAWKTNPNTSAAWLTAAAQAVEGGMEAIT